MRYEGTMAMLKARLQLEEHLYTTPTIKVLTTFDDLHLLLQGL